MYDLACRFSLSPSADAGLLIYQLRKSCVDSSCIARHFEVICALVRSRLVSGLFTRFSTAGPPSRDIAAQCPAGQWMGSANQVPFCIAGFEARDFRRGVLVVTADCCGPVPLSFRPKCSFKRRSFQKPRGFSSSVPSVCGGDYRSH